MNMNENNVLEACSDDELTAATEAHLRLLAWAQSLTPQQIAYLCDGGWYNVAIRGYLVAAAQNAGMNREQISLLLDGLRCAFEDMDMRDAETRYQQF